MSLYNIEDSAHIVEGNTVRWNSGFNKTIFKFQRQDKQINSIQNYVSEPNKFNCYIWTSNPDVGVASDDISGYIYLNSAPYNNYYKVLACEYFGSLRSRLVLEGQFIQNVWNIGFVNSLSLKPNYNIVLQVMMTGQTLTFYYKPDATGLLSFNISQIIQKLFEHNLIKVSNYNSDSIKSIEYRIGYGEKWTDSGTVRIAVTKYFYLGDTAKELGDELLDDYILLEVADRDCKFLSNFEKPCYFKGYPFDLSFVFSDNITKDILRERNQKKNGVLILNNDNLLDNSFHKKINKLSVDDLEVDVDKIEIWLKTSADDIEPHYVIADYVLNDYVK